MVRVPLPQADLENGSPWSIDEDVYAYLIRVHRLKEDNLVTVFNGQGFEVDALLRQNEGQWCLVATGPVRSGRIGHELTLVYGIPKGEKLDLVVRQATELGVGKVVLYASERSVVKLTSERATKRINRLKKIIAESARQSGRADLMTIVGPLTLSEAMAEVESCATRLVLHPEGGAPLNNSELNLPAALAVGPEGGLSEAEITTLTNHGWHPVSLNCPVLRTETAATVACALVLHHTTGL